MSTRQPLTVAAVLLLLPCVVQAQDVGPDVDPGRLLLEDKEQRNVHVLSTHGPTGGMVVDLTYGMGDEPALYGLTEVGVFRYDRERRFWERTPILAPEDPTLPIVPMRVDMAHLIGERELYPPMSVELHVEAQHAYLLTEQNNVFRAPLKGGSWVAMSPPNDTVAGRVPFEAASRVSMAIGPDQTASMVLLRSDPELSRAQEQSRLWWVKSGRQRWQSTDLAGRSTLIRTSRPTGIGASWRYEGLMTSIAFGKGRYQVQRFVHLIEEMGKLSFDTLAWASLLDNSGSEIREGCWDATGMMEVTTWAGEGEPPVLIAIGARTLCVSTDGGLTFAVRDTHLDPTRPREVIGHMASATAFAHRDAQAGVRLIVGTQAVLNPAGPKTRADGGRLFMSDDAGRTWTDITPDIDAPGGFVDLESYAIDSAQGGTEVWLLTERRGVYLSTTAGMGFDQANVALSAQPIHGIATDPTAIDQILAAGPTGTFKSSTNGWSQTLLLPARSIASVPATPDDQGQVWIGSYWGQVQVRHQLTGFEAEPLPKPDPTDPIMRPIDVRAEFGKLPRPIPISRPLRPVSAVVPVDLVKHEGRLTDRGYALVDGEGLYYRGPLGWARMALPMTPPIRVVAMVGIPLKDNTPGVALLVHSDLADASGGELWMFAEPRGWLRQPLPANAIPETATRIGNRIWVGTTQQALQAVDINEGRMSLGPTVETRIRCTLLVPSPKDGLACIASGEPQLPDPEAPNAEIWRPMAQVLKLPASVVSGALPPSNGVRPVPHVATHPTGRRFKPPTFAAWTRNSVGDHLWLSTGDEVYTTIQAIFDALPPEAPEDEQGIPVWAWILIALTSMLGISGAGLLLKRRQVHT